MNILGGVAFLTAASLSEPGKIPSGVKRKPKYVTLVEPKLHLFKFNFRFALRKRLKRDWRDLRCEICSES